jgi:large subunit ribosomal protein L29
MKRKEQLKEYKGLSLTILLKKEADLKIKIFDLKMKTATGKVKNTAQIRWMRKELARIKTLVFEKATKEMIEETKEVKEKTKKTDSK